MEEKALDVHKAVERMITGILELGGGVVVHEDGHVSWATSPGEAIYADNPPKEPQIICTYKTDCKIPGAVIINPLAETVGQITSEKRWFYQVTGMIYSRTTAYVIQKLLETAVAAVSGNMEIKDPCFIHALQGIIGYVDSKTDKEVKLINKKTRDYTDVLDEKMLEEFDLIRKANILDFVSITYNRESRTSTLRTCFGDPEEAFKKQFGNRIRKKTWEMLETLIREIFAVEDLTKPIVSVQITDLRCPQFRAYLEVLVKGWSFLLPYLGHIYSEETAEHMATEIVYLESCIPNLIRFAEKGMWASLTTMKPIKMDDGSVVDRNTEILVDTVAKRAKERQDIKREVREVIKEERREERREERTEARDEAAERREANKPVGLSDESPSTMDVMRDRLNQRDRSPRRLFGNTRDDDYDRDRDRRDNYGRRGRYDYDDRDRDRDRGGRFDRGCSALDNAYRCEEERRYYRSGGRYDYSRDGRRRGGDYVDSIV